MNVEIELLIQHGKKLYQPCVEEGITWSTERQGTPGQLDFKVVDDGKLKMTEGDAVRLKVNGKKVFYGFIFTLKRDVESLVTITAYDQLRYLKNKDTYVYENKTAGEVIKLIASDFRLQTGTVANTKYKIPSRVEENTSLIDMIQNALDLTLTNTGKMYVLYDNFGKLTLKNMDDMRLNVLIDEDTGENFDYTSSINENTYNKVKSTYDNEKTGKREVYIAQSSKNMNQWGILQYFEKIDKGVNGKAKADALLSLYNAKTKQLSIKNAFGNVKVRGGSLIGMMLNLGDMKVNNVMLVEKCKHEFNDGQHTMDLTLRGGDFIV